MENCLIPTSIKLGDHCMCFYKHLVLLHERLFVFFSCFIRVNFLPHTSIHITFTLSMLSCEGRGHACLIHHHHIPST